MLELSLLQSDGGRGMLRLLDAGPAGQVVLFISDLQTHRERLLVGGAGLVRQPVLVPHLPASTLTSYSTRITTHLVEARQLIDKTHGRLLLSCRCAGWVGHWGENSVEREG